MNPLSVNYRKSKRLFLQVIVINFEGFSVYIHDENPIVLVLVSICICLQILLNTRYASSRFVLLKQNASCRALCVFINTVDYDAAWRPAALTHRPPVRTLRIPDVTAFTLPTTLYPKSILSKQSSF